MCVTYGGTATSAGTVATDQLPRALGARRKGAQPPATFLDVGSVRGGRAIRQGSVVVLSPQLLERDSVARRERGWLGHESIETTRIYLFADLDLKERAIARTQQLGGPPSRYHPPDSMIAWLEEL